jgi:hypothetical protein
MLYLMILIFRKYVFPMRDNGDGIVHAYNRGALHASRCFGKDGWHTHMAIITWILHRRIVVWQHTFDYYVR